jgi:hypothetical protein
MIGYKHKTEFNVCHICPYISIHIIINKTPGLDNDVKLLVSSVFYGDVLFLA